MTTTDAPHPPNDGLSIGALAQAVGVPVATLRTWESRYGYPRAERLPSGHRRFPAQAVERLRLVARLLERGHRASSVVAADLSGLQALLALGEVLDLGTQLPAPVRDARPLSRWFKAVDHFDVLELEAHLREGWNQSGALPFLEGDLSRFLTELGALWRAGQLDVAREHLASSTIALFLGRQWRAMSDVSDGPVAVCATLPGEAHELGLHMAAVALALGGCRVRFLGADTPIPSIVTAARQLAASAVVIASSPAADPKRLREALADLRGRLASGVTLWVGGQAPVEHEGIATWPASLTALATDARKLAR